MENLRHGAGSTLFTIGIILAVIPVLIVLLGLFLMGELKEFSYETGTPGDISKLR